MSDCLFCNMVKYEIPAEIVFENHEILGFKDIYPQSAFHLLFIHKEHSKNLIEIEDKHILDIFNGIREYCKKESLDQTGFRIVNNCGKDAGQTVFHTHFHLLAGEKLGSFGV